MVLVALALQIFVVVYTCTRLSVSEWEDAGTEGHDIMQVSILGFRVHLSLPVAVSVQILESRLQSGREGEVKRERYDIKKSGSDKVLLSLGAGCFLVTDIRVTLQEALADGAARSW